jgi:hypothetical protein
MYLSKYIRHALPVIEESLPAETREEREKELRNREDHVLVEEVKDHLANSDVGPMPMHQKKPPKAPELSQCEIGGLNSPHSFISIEPHANMRFLDHVHVIGSIANR